MNPLFEKRPRRALSNFELEVLCDLRACIYRFVKWPNAVGIQRQRRIIEQCLRVHPALNEFTDAPDKNIGTVAILIL